MHVEVDHQINPTEMTSCRPGEPRLPMLERLAWRGRFRCAGLVRERTHYAVDYSLSCPGKPKSVGIVALFVDEAFVKFVRWSAVKGPVERVLVPGSTSTISRPVARPIDSLDWYELAEGSAAVEVQELEAEIAAYVPRVYSQPDRGLGDALIAAGIQWPSASDIERDRRRNAALCERYNLSRLSLGMSEEDVENVFGMGPLATGDFEKGRVSVYGSDEYIAWEHEHRWSNVVVLFRNGKLLVAHGVRAGSGWRAYVNQKFSDLPFRL